MTLKKLLLVDDDGLILSTFGKGLSDHGYDVMLMDSGEEAVRVIENGQDIDLAILDIRMPGLSGIETANLIKAFGVPSIFLSAYDDDEYVKKAVNAGGLGYLVKPVDVARAIPTIESALKRAREMQILLDTKERLDCALETGNQVNVVIGILMERHKLKRQQAFDLLRQNARSNRRKVKDVAQEYLDAWDIINFISISQE